MSRPTPPPGDRRPPARARAARSPASACSGGRVLAHLLDLAGGRSSDGADRGPRPARRARAAPRRWSPTRPSGRFVFAPGPPPEGRGDPPDRPALRPGPAPRGAPARARPGVGRRSGGSTGPQALAGAEDELIRRRTYQPLGRYWALGPARRLARGSAPTPVRPNAVTLASAALMLAAVGARRLRAGRRWPREARRGVALALALVLDTADGHLARLQGTASEFGRWLDAMLDELGDMALHAAIAWAAFARDGRRRLAARRACSTRWASTCSSVGDRAAEAPRRRRGGAAGRARRPPASSG